MTDGTDHLASAITAHVREWEVPFVEQAIFASDDGQVIAQAIEAFCRKHLGVGVARALFHQSSIGSVTGVALDDGRSVVIKAHQPERSLDFLTEIVRIQSYLADRKVFATRVLVGPLPLGSGFAIVEEFTDVGAAADAHEPRIRRALARGLHTIVETCAPLVASTSLAPIFAPPDGALWPTPHSKLFDFSAAGLGADWIDAVARLARERLVPAGRRVIGHGDWRQEHVRFAGGEPAVAFDWDSLCCQDEPALVGFAAHGFCADWSLTDRAQAPSFEEARVFCHDYEEARGAPFSADERRLCGAAFAYACAYAARCSHAGSVDEREMPGGFQHLVWTERDNLLAM